MNFKLLNILALLIIFVVSPSHGEHLNSLNTYLQDIEVQAETDEQYIQVKNAFLDMLILPASELKMKRYKDYQGNPNRWSIQELLNRHVCPVSADHMFNEKTFYKELETPEVKDSLTKIIRHFLANKPAQIRL